MLNTEIILNSDKNTVNDIIIINRDRFSTVGNMVMINSIIAKC